MRSEEGRRIWMVAVLRTTPTESHENQLEKDKSLRSVLVRWFRTLAAPFVSQFMVFLVRRAVAADPSRSLGLPWVRSSSPRG